jgi:hypothetical protein
LLGENHKQIDKLINSTTPKVIISIANKYIVNLEMLIPAFQTTLFPERQIGIIHNSKKKNQPNSVGTHKFKIVKKEYVLLFLKYLNDNRSSSVKHKRLDLILSLYDLKNQKAYLQKSGALLNQKWADFCKAWYHVL